jgi:hypothetical protein
LLLRRSLDLDLFGAIVAAESKLSVLKTKGWCC